jgi:hypothetical protein
MLALKGGDDSDMGSARETEEAGTRMDSVALEESGQGVK